MNLSGGLPRRKFEIFPWEPACLLGVLFFLVVRLRMGDPRAQWSVEGSTGGRVVGTGREAREFNVVTLGDAGLLFFPIFCY